MFFHNIIKLTLFFDITVGESNENQNTLIDEKKYSVYVLKLWMNENSEKIIIIKNYAILK